MKLLILLMFFVIGCKPTYYAMFPDNHGHAKVSFDGSNVKWRLKLKKIKTTIMAHIHCKPSDEIGLTFSPVGAFAWADSSGNASAPDVGNDCGWRTSKDLKAAMDAGTAYVNVHTLEKPKGAVEATLRSLGYLNQMEMDMRWWAGLDR